MYVLFLNAVFWMLVQLKALESSSSGMKKASCLVHCPINEQKWKERAMEYNCTSGMSYHCILTQAGVCELCFAKFTVRKSGCPTIAWDNDTEKYHPELRNKDCPVNITGCPDWGIEYSSDELYRFPLCTRSNQTDDDKIGNSQTTPSHAPATTEHVFSSTPSSNTDTRNNYSGKHETWIIILGVMLAFFGSVFLVWLARCIYKRKSIHGWVLHKRTQRRRRRQNNEIMEYRSDANPNQDESLLPTQIRKSDENERPNCKDSVACTNEQRNETSQAPKKMTLQAKDENDELELESDEHLTHVSSVTVPWVTFTENTCVVRCRVSRHDIKCTWHKKHTNGEKYQINDGDEIKVSQKKTFRMLFLPKKPDFDGTYVCTLENGNEVEIDIDVEDSGTIMATVGEENKFVRKLDETGSPCIWYKNETPLQTDEQYIITETNEESTLTIKSVGRGDPIPFGSKIGKEIQYYTLVSEDTENAQTDQTDLKLPDCDNQKENNETGCLANPVDETDSGYTKDEAQGSACDNVDSQPLVRKYHDEQHQGLKNILGKVFRVSEWEKITELSRNIVTLFKGLPQTIFEEEDLQGLKSVVRQSTVECQKCVGGIFKYLLNILSNFENIPDQENTAYTRVTVVELRVDLSNLIDFEAESKKEFDKSNASLEKNRKSFLRKIEEIEKDLQTKKVYPEEKNRLREGFTSIFLHLGDICDILSNIMHSLSSLSNCLRNYRKVPQTSQEIRAMLHSLKTASLNLSDRISLESINDSLKEEFKDVLLQCNANTRQNEAVMEDSEENARQLLFGEEIDNRV